MSQLPLTAQGDPKKSWMFTKNILQMSKAPQLFQTLASSQQTALVYTGWGWEERQSGCTHHQKWNGLFCGIVYFTFVYLMNSVSNYIPRKCSDHEGIGELTFQFATKVLQKTVSRMKTYLYKFCFQLYSTKVLSNYIPRKCQNSSFHFCTAREPLQKFYKNCFKKTE